MTYQQTVLNDKPAGFWMITAASGTSETDLSGNSKTATITEATDLIDRGYRPLVTGTSTDRAFRFYSHNHKLSYPAMEAWEKGRDHIPFSVELTVQPVNTVVEAILFAPQVATALYVPDNGIYIKDHTLFFVTSNGSNLAPATIKTSLRYPLSQGFTYHVVAVYSVDKMFLYVNNELVDQADVDPAQRFTHATANFITLANRGTTDPLKSEFIIDGVSFYRSALSPDQINKHYVMSTPNISDLEIVNGLGGKIIKLNDADRQKSLDFSTKEAGWTKPGNIITDLVENEDGSLGLKKIEPVKLYNTVDNYTNMLTWNQATVDVDISNWFNQTPSIANMTRTTTAGSVLSGTGSLLFDCIVAGTASAIPDTRFPITPGTTYTGSASFKLIAGAAPGNVSNCKMQFYDEADIFITEFQGATFTPNASWQQSTMTAVAPDNARYVRLQVVSRGLAIGNQVAFDNMGIWAGGSTNWTPPPAEAFVSNKDLSKTNYNLAPYALSTAEEAATWYSYNAHPTPTRTTADAYYGDYSLTQTANSTSEIQSGTSATTGTGTGFFKVTPGMVYTVRGAAKSPTGAGTFRPQMRFHTAAGVYIGYGTVIGPTITSSWQVVEGQVTAPANAAYASLAWNVNSPTNAAVYYFDHFAIHQGVTTTYTEPRFNIDEINLTDSRYVRVDNAGSYLSKDVGGFGFFADFSAVENDHVGEQALAALSSSDGVYTLEVVKKADKTLNLRYRYQNQAGVITTTDTSWGAISSLLATNVYIYVEWGGGVATMYVNSTSSPAQVAFDAGVPAPVFDEKSFFHLGAGFDKNRPWNNFFKWLKLYDKAQDTANFVYNKTSTNGFTAKLGSNLNVSQVGKALIEVPVPVDSTEAVDQTRVTWEPLSQNISVKTSPSGTTNLLTYNQATNETDTTGLGLFSGCTISRSVGISASGTASMLMTSTSTNTEVSAGTTLAAATPVYEGKTYTAHVKMRAGTTTGYFKSYIVWYNSADAQIGLNGSAQMTNAGTTWVTCTNTAVAPAGAVKARTLALFRSGASAGETAYADELGLWEGSDTTWTEPLQAATYGSEIVPDQFPSTLSNNYYALATLSTDDSYYAPTKLTDLKLEAFSNGLEYAENGWDQLIGSTRDRVYPTELPEITQGLYNGALMSSTRNAFYILPVDDTKTVSIPDGGTAASTAGSSALIRTLEFWLYPEVQGYYVYHDGATEYSMRYYDSGGFTTTGFTTLYVDGTVQANASTLSTWYNRWHHIVLTNASTQININTDAPAGNNLITANQASVETAITGITAGSYSTVARSTADSIHGTACAAGTASSPVGFMTVGLVQQGHMVPASPGQTFTAVAHSKAATTSRNVYIRMEFFPAIDSYSALGGASSTSIPNSTTSWTKHSVSATAPAGTTHVGMYAYITSPVNGEVHYFDQMMITQGTSSKWSLPGETPPRNLLTPNQSTGGDHLGSVLGFTDHGGGGLTYDTTRSVTGAGSIKHTAVSVRHSTSTQAQLTPVTPGKTYTAQAKVYPGASPTGGFGWALYIEWRDINSVVLSQSLSSVTLTQDRWNTMTATGVAPAGAAQALVLIYRNAVAGVTPEDAWMDEVGLWEGTSTIWSPSDAKMNFGIPLIGGTQSVARYQNISYYPQSFDATAVTNNYKAYLGDMTAAAPVDYSNMLSYNQATAEDGTTTGMSVTYNPGGLSIALTNATDQFYSGSRSWKLVYSSGTGVAQVNLTTPTATNAVIPVTPSTTYSATARFRCTAARNATIAIDWWTSAGGYINSATNAVTLVSNTWTKLDVTATAPSNAAYASVGVVSTNPVSGDSYWFDEIGLWHGSGTTWISPADNGTRSMSDVVPKFYSDVWEVQSTVTR